MWRQAQSYSVPTFSGVNERKFREDLSKLISSVTFFGSRPSDEDIGFTLENCFLASDDIKDKLGAWVRKQEADRHMNPSVKTNDLVNLAKSYVGLSIADPRWESSVLSFRKLQEKMVVKSTDEELHIVDQARIQKAQKPEGERILKFTNDNFKLLASGGAVALSGLGTPIPVRTGLPSLDELESLDSQKPPIQTTQDPMDDLIKKFENLNVFVNQWVSSFSVQQSAALSEIRSIASTLKEKTPARTSTQIKVENPPVPVRI
ncbi:hypothetical protein HDU67_000826, partial [Dinochytrium kinnereticum]